MSDDFIYSPDVAPIVEKISQNIVLALQAYRPGPGAPQTIKDVQRVTSIPTVAADGLCVVMQGDPEPAENLAPNRLASWDQPYLIFAYVQVSQHAVGREAIIEQKINFIRADIEKALMADPRRGQLALVDQTFKRPTLFSSDGAEGVIIELWVRYSTLRNDPYTQAI